MTQVDKPTVAGSAGHGNQQPPPTADPREASREAITAAATAVVAEVITTAHGEAGRKGKETMGSTSKEATTPASATSKTRGEATTAPDNKAEVSGVASDSQLGASPRSMKPGGDLRASFLAAVGNTISLTVRRHWCCTAPLQLGRILPYVYSGPSLSFFCFETMSNT